MSLKFTKSQRSLLVVLGVFVLPVVLAKLALENNWFNYGVTNFGTLAKGELTLGDIGIESTKFDEQWLMVYRAPADCNEQCTNVLLAVNNTYTLLGKELPRVTPVILTEQPLTDEVQQNLKHHKWQEIPLVEQAKDHLQLDRLIIVDTLGNVVMTHDIPNDQAQLSTFSKNVLADMKKLLKYSRIG